MQIGRAAQQDLGDRFPTFDDFDFETGEGTQIFSTNQIQTPEKLVQAIGGKAAQFDQSFENTQVFRGADSDGIIVSFNRTSVGAKYMLVVTPPIRNFPLSRIASQIESIEQMYGFDEIQVVESEAFLP